MGQRITEQEMDWKRFDDHRRVSVVGAPYHQPALLTASCHQLLRVSDRYETAATLQREPGNDHDPQAVAVVVDGKRVGYLKSEVAKRLNERVAQLEEEDQWPACPLLIRFASPGFLQAHLQIPYSSDLLQR